MKGCDPPLYRHFLFSALISVSRLLNTKVFVTSPGAGLVVERKTEEQESLTRQCPYGKMASGLSRLGKYIYLLTDFFYGVAWKWFSHSTSSSNASLLLLVGFPSQHPEALFQPWTVGISLRLWASPGQCCISLMLTTSSL